MTSNSNGLEPSPGVGVLTVTTDLLDEHEDVFEGLGDLPGE